MPWLSWRNCIVNAQRHPNAVNLHPHFVGAGHALQAAADAWSNLGERALSAPAGMLGIIGGTISTLPRILLGDVVGAYQAASEVLARTEAAGLGQPPYSD